MKSDAIAFGVAGIVFGLIAGWIIGSQQGARAPAAPVSAQAPAAAASSGGAGTRAAVLAGARLGGFASVAAREPSNAKPRVELANLYFDAERYDDAIKWYADAVRLSPNDVNVSTDLAVAYYYTNQPEDRKS